MTVQWPADLVRELVGHGHTHLGAVSHAVANQLCLGAAARIERSHRTTAALDSVIESGRYSTRVKNELIEWHNEELEYRRGVLDGVLPLAEALTAAVRRDEDLWRRFDEFRFGEAVQQARTFGLGVN